MRRIPYRQLVKALPFRQSFTCSGHVKASAYRPPLASVPTSTHVAPLTHRALVRVQGKDASTLLQGLVTCDVFSGSEVTYSMMLNVQGRVLYDVILYQHNGGHLLECDARAVLDIVKHLKKYALRSKVEISRADSDYGLWAAFPGTPGKTSSQKVTSFFSDPRVSEFGTRVLLPQGVHAQELWTDLKECTSDVYHRHRLEMGIPEGMDEIPVGKALPLEYNLDYMNGVSFDKGCYLGQELTARTHHTGVVRKRVMPIALGESPDKLVQPGTSITAGGKSVGKLVCHHGSVGLALLRLQEIKYLCYRTKVRDCDPLTQCTYRNRGENTSLTTLANTTIVHFKSPGKFEENKYRNNDFCIYNVSTNCSGKHIVVQTADTTDLNDMFVDSSGRRRCSDYLEFDFVPGHFLCGDELNNYTSPPLPQNSFLAFFWTSSKGNKGRFEISAQCTDIPIPPTETTMASGDEAGDNSSAPSGDFPDQDEHSL